MTAKVLTPARLICQHEQALANRMAHFAMRGEYDSAHRVRAALKQVAVIRAQFAHTEHTGAWLN